MKQAMEIKEKEGNYPSSHGQNTESAVPQVFAYEVQRCLSERSRSELQKEEKRSSVLLSHCGQMASLSSHRLSAVCSAGCFQTKLCN